MDVDNPVKKILILSANPQGTAQLRLGQEVRDIRKGLERAKKREQFDLEEKWAVTPRDVSRAMLDNKPNIVHFSGHGAGIDGLVLEDDVGLSKLVNSEALAELFELFADTVECVVLNACYSVEQANAIVRHIDYVIGMSQAVGDRAAIEFSVSFYDALAAGNSIDFAYKLGCNSINLAGLSGGSTPVLKKKLNEKTRALEEECNSYKDLLKQNPNDDLVWRKLGSVLSNLGCYQESAAAYEKAIELKPNNPIVWRQKGTSLAEAGEYEKAVNSYEKAIELQSEDYSAWCKRGLALAQLGQHEEAVNSYDRALKLKPDASDNYVILTERGLALKQIQEYKRAIDSYNKALEIEPAYRAAKYEQRWIYKNWNPKYTD